MFFAVSFSSCLEKAAWNFSEEKRIEVARLIGRQLGAFFLFALPCGFTHVIPMGILYFWLALVVIGIMVLAVVILYGIFFCCQSKDLHALPENYRGPHLILRRFILSFLELESKLLATLVRIFLVLSAVFLGQTLMHYGALYYGDEHRYLDVIWTEYTMRSTSCYLMYIESLLKQLSAYSPFLSIFIL